MKILIHLSDVLRALTCQLPIWCTIWKTCCADVTNLQPQFLFLNRKDIRFTLHGPHKSIHGDTYQVSVICDDPGDCEQSQLCHVLLLEGSACSKVLETMVKPGIEGLVMCFPAGLCSLPCDSGVLIFMIMSLFPLYVSPLSGLLWLRCFQVGYQLLSSQYWELLSWTWWPTWTKFLHRPH